MSRHLLIDGYNVLGKMGQLADLSLEDRRNGLVKFIEINRPQGSFRNAVTVVFDGQDGICSLNMSVEVKVAFSKGESADDLIKRYIEKSVRPKDIVLVTDDRELQYFCRALGAEIWSVPSFLAQCRKSGQVLKSGRSSRQKTVGENKVVSSTLEAKVNHELRQIWLKGQK